MNNLVRMVALPLALSSACLAGAASAAVVEFTGQTVKYVFDTGSDSLDGYLDLYGSVQVLPGTDTLRFLPDGWVAQAQYGGAPVASANDTINFSVVALDDNTTIQSVSLSGGGDYYKVGGFVGVGGELRVNSTDIAKISAGDFSTTLGPGDPIVTTTWTESASLDGYNASSLAITVENLLSARIVTLDNGNVVFDGIDAFIEKKYVDISVSTVVPVPAAAWLMVSALGVAGFSLRKRREG